jgi:NifB/MoaA-like Fe-S oxidoreductase
MRCRQDRALAHIRRHLNADHIHAVVKVAFIPGKQFRSRVMERKLDRGS